MHNGIQRWSDPAGIWSNLDLTRHIFRSRSKPTIAQQITGKDGGLTCEMTKQLNDKTREEYLRWELDIPDLIRLEAILIGAVSRTTKRHSIEASEQAWLYLRRMIVDRPKKGKKVSF